MKDSSNFGTTSVAGVVSNNAFKFDGISAYRNFGTTNIGGATTISFWAHWEDFNSWSRIFDFGNG